MVVRDCFIEGVLVLMCGCLDLNERFGDAGVN